MHAPGKADINFDDQTGVRRWHVREHVHNEAHQQRDGHDVEEPGAFGAARQPNGAGRRSISVGFRNGPGGLGEEGG